MANSDFFSRRRAGVLLHPTSLPGSQGNGDLGADAYRFVDFLADCGFTLWQMLPLGPTHEDLSPYQCQSVHAGSDCLINLQQLVEWGWLDDAHLSDAGSISAQRREKLQVAFAGFEQHATEQDRQAYQDFLSKHNSWLDDFALYRAIKEEHHGAAWMHWAADLRDRQPEAMALARQRLSDALEQARFEQFLFFRQWHALRDYANQRGVLLFGDIPIFVAHDSSDVWAQRDYFSVNAQGEQEVVAGVPPDYFSDTGQRWGNPLYRWDKLQADGFHWWIERIATQLELFDLMRIDHFRGFEAYWEINASEETAINGQWKPGPGAKIFTALKAAFEHLPLVAEDLGVITHEVTELRKQFDMPGMKILQFAFDGSPDNPYLPHNHEPMSVVYTGTHDNDTSLGWYRSLDDAQRENIKRYFGEQADPMPWLLIRAALASVASVAIVPMQDLLALASEHRMNIPGVIEGNWQWRFDWSQLESSTNERMRDWIALYGRKA